jgi:hypothetical protein
MVASKWPTWKAVAAALFLMAACGGVEVGLILSLRVSTPILIRSLAETMQPIYERGIEYPMVIIGVIASVFLALGLIPPYFEIWKRRGRVVGFNWAFLTIDWLGAFFSLMALVAQHTFDILGGVIYIVCLILEGGIFTCHFIWLFRTRKIRKAAHAEGKTFDDTLQEHIESGVPFAFSERKIRFKKEDVESKFHAGNAAVQPESGTSVFEASFREDLPSS